MTKKTLNGIVCDAATFFNSTTQKLELVLPLEVGKFITKFAIIACCQLDNCPDTSGTPLLLMAAWPTWCKDGTAALPCSGMHCNCFSVFNVSMAWPARCSEVVQRDGSNYDSGTSS